MAAQIEQPLETYRDSDGTPLENGYIYVGTSGLNAETNQVSVYWDSDFTIPASQPIRTIGGFASRNGTKANIFVNGSYSIVIKDKNGVLVFSGDSLTDPAIAVGVNDAQLRAWEAEAEALTAESYAIEPEDTFVNVYTSDGDGTFTATPTTDYSSLHWAAKSAATGAYLPLAGGTMTGTLNGVDASFTGNIDAANLLSGSYTPVVSNTTNVTSSVVETSYYTRVGNIVSVFGSIGITPTATSTLTAFDITIPISSTFSSIYNCIGVGTTSVSTFRESATVSGRALTSVAAIGFISTTSASNHQIAYNFSYLIE